MPIPRPSLVLVTRSCAVLLAVACLLLSTGCAGRSIPGSGIQPLAAARSVHGGVHGGQQPIVGSSVSLFATRSPGAGVTSVSLLPAPAVTDADGSFTLDPSSYTCGAPDDLVYFVAVGGDAGAGINNNIALAALLGSCSTLTPNSFVTVNEVTTVAAAYTMAAFGSDGDVAFSTPGPVDSGSLSSAWNNSSHLAVSSTGTASTALGGPVGATVDSLANTVAACVNSTQNSGACTQLFALSTPAGRTTPDNANTFSAMVHIAQNPSNNVTDLFDLAPPNPPFQPALTTPPSDWTLPVSTSN